MRHARVEYPRAGRFSLARPAAAQSAFSQAMTAAALRAGASLWLASTATEPLAAGAWNALEGRPRGDQLQAVRLNDPEDRRAGGQAGRGLAHRREPVRVEIAEIDLCAQRERRPPAPNMVAERGDRVAFPGRHHRPRLRHVPGEAAGPVRALGGVAGGDGDDAGEAGPLRRVGQADVGAEAVARDDDLGDALGPERSGRPVDLGEGRLDRRVEVPVVGPGHLGRRGREARFVQRAPQPPDRGIRLVGAVFAVQQHDADLAGCGGLLGGASGEQRKRQDQPQPHEAPPHRALPRRYSVLATPTCSRNFSSVS